ncbi:MAG: hypothetical protein KAR51_02815, partial [Candidatus Aenigmarchaeota archaeon]|nr:hypothetical protein [Candidatus Aenigmarchaeota archaeon]
MLSDKKVLVLDASKGKAVIEAAPLGSVGPIDVSVYYHLNVLKSYDKDVYDPDNALVFGCGPFAGAK